MTFSGEVSLYPGEATPTLSGDYFSGGVSVAATLATSLVGSPVANTFPPSTTISIQDGTLTSYAAIPLIPNVVAYSLGDNLFSVGSGGVPLNCQRRQNHFGRRSGCRKRRNARGQRRDFQR